MRIARIIEYFPPRVGGMERHALALSQEQVRLGHEVNVFIGFGDSDYDRLKIYKMPFQFLPLYSKLRRLWFNFWAARQVVKNHKKIPYNVIHCHGDLIEAHFAGRLAERLEIPAILTIHGGLNSKILKNSNARIFNRLHRIICVSLEIRNSLLAIGIGENKLVVISSGIYLKEFSGPKLVLGFSKPIIISVGVLTKQKGFEYLIEAFRMVENKIPTASLLIIGDGPERRNLLQKTQNLSNIYLFGGVSHEKIVKYLMGSDIFVLASVTMSGYHEGTPTSLLEAMAASLPIVTTKSGGISYLIKENINGLLVEEKNAKALAEAIIKLLEDEDSRRQMKKRNLEDIKEKDWPLIARQITNVYLQ